MLTAIALALAAFCLGLRFFFFSFFGFSPPSLLPPDFEDPPSDPESEAFEDVGEGGPAACNGVTFFFPDVHGDGFKPFLKWLCLQKVIWKFSTPP